MINHNKKSQKRYMRIDVSEKILNDFPMKNYEYICTDKFDYDPQFRIYSYLSTFYDRTIIVNIGTSKGCSALALSHNESNTIITYDTTDLIKNQNHKIFTKSNIKYKADYKNDLGDKDFISKIRIVAIDTTRSDIDAKHIIDQLYDNDFAGIILLHDIVNSLNNVKHRTAIRDLWNNLTYNKCDLTEFSHCWPGIGMILMHIQIDIRMIKSKTFFLAADGIKMTKGVPNDFARSCDWVFLNPTNIIRNTKIPKIVYIHTDSLPALVKNLVPAIENDFILITSCSDYSPSVNFKNEYNALIENKYLKCWYTSNNLSDHPKMRSIPGGLSVNYSANPAIEDILMKLRKETSINEKTDKVLCIWRNRTTNDCGRQFVTRAKTKEFVLKHPHIFDWYDNCDQTKFYDLLKRYKFVLCPVGNGVDPCPKSSEAIILRTIPIIIRTINTKDDYKDMPCILVDDFNEILQPNFMMTKFKELEEMLLDDKILYKLSNEYWINKIRSNFDPDNYLFINTIQDQYSLK